MKLFQHIAAAVVAISLATQDVFGKLPSAEGLTVF
jgi:hypothetical protein